ncbi:MAG TPA: hypothetical protein VJY33_17635 [Isosphaeraceae bacterium]|nr:hypothetical protein [Isosphaeraceae bacterium]
MWKRQPGARYTLRINRLASAAPEIFYVSFPLPTGSQLPRLTNGGMPFVPFADQLPGTCRDYFAIDGAGRRRATRPTATGSGSVATCA